jgi:hypothetical protein
MTFDDYRKTESWRLAIEAARALARLRDELPAGEDGGLGNTLQQLTVDLPTAVGRDLITGQQTRHDAYIAVQAALALVEAIYPALDVAVTEEALQKLITHAADPVRFNELVPTITFNTPSDDDDDEDDQDSDEEETEGEEEDDEADV